MAGNSQTGCCVCGGVGNLSSSDTPFITSSDSEQSISLWLIHQSYEGLVGKGELPVKIHAHFPDVPKIRLMDQSSALCTTCFLVIHDVLVLEKEMLRAKAKIQVQVGSEREIVTENKMFPANKNKSNRETNQRKKKQNLTATEESGIVTRARRKTAFVGLSKEMIQAELEEENVDEPVSNQNASKRKAKITKRRTAKAENISLHKKQDITGPTKERMGVADTHSMYKDGNYDDFEHTLSIPIHEKFFNCPKCCDYFKKEDIEAFKTHISTVCGVYKRFPCALCGHIFTSNSVLTKHKEQIHANLNVNPKSAKTKPRLKSKMKRVPVEPMHEDELDENEWPVNKQEAERLGNQTGTWKCWFCFYESHKKPYWTAHVSRSHPTEIGKHFDCKHCNFPFTEKHHLREHLQEVHLTESGFKCDSCGRNFLHKNSQHLCSTIKCEICQEQFSKKGDKTKHMLKSHPEYKPFSCSSCSKTFQKQEYLAIHERIHNNERPYECEQCDKSFRMKSHYNNHVRIHSGEKRYICHACGQALSSPQSLYNHLQSHDSSKTFSCEICGKSFRAAYDVKRHKVIHSGAKPYECKYCKKVFNRRGNCLAHERNHVNKKDTERGVSTIQSEEAY